MSRPRVAYLVALLAAALPSTAAAEAIPSELQQMLETVEREEANEQYAAAYVRLKEVERRAKDGEHPAVLERVDELAPFLESATRRQVRNELDRYMRAQTADKPELAHKLGPPSEPRFASECAYDEDARHYACNASVEGLGAAFRCVAGEGAVRCSRD